MKKLLLISVLSFTITNAHAMDDFVGGMLAGIGTSMFFGHISNHNHAPQYGGYAVPVYPAPVYPAPVYPAPTYIDPYASAYMQGVEDRMRTYQRRAEASLFNIQSRARWQAYQCGRRGYCR